MREVSGRGWRKVPHSPVPLLFSHCVLLISAASTQPLPASNARNGEPESVAAASGRSVRSPNDGNVETDLGGRVVPEEWNRQGESVEEPGQVVVSYTPIPPHYIATSSYTTLPSPHRLPPCHQRSQLVSSPPSPVSQSVIPPRHLQTYMHISFAYDRRNDHRAGWLN